MADRLGQFSSPLLGSYSLPSLAEGSEAISEAEEINEVKSLHDRGVRAAKTSHFKEAVQYYNEALEIDSSDVRVLQARAQAFLQQGKTLEASQDADAILAIDPSNSQGHLLQGLALYQYGQHKPALTAMLQALELDTHAADKVTMHLAKAVASICQVPKEIVNNLKGMDPYEKLSELGVILFQNRRYEECISILETSRKFQTNQKGITMRILLTQANAHSQILQTEAAIELYQECLALAVATHEQTYQTKALVNMATLHLERGDTHQAIIFYEKLLHLGQELRLQSGSNVADADVMDGVGLAEVTVDEDDDEKVTSSQASPKGKGPEAVKGEGRMPDYWTKELQCGLHLNLSIAYKTIGNMSVAAKHAVKYMSLAKKFGLDPKLVAESHHNTGMLNEILGHYDEALECYKEYLTISKKNGNKKGVGQAYGCLASVYAALRNWPLALTFHGQQLAMAQHGKDRKLTALAHEMMGDTLSLKGDHEAAIEHYNQMLMLCRSRDNRGDATSRCKMAAAYKDMGQLQYSLYYYTEALTLARRFGLSDLETMAEFHVACINKDSTQLVEREEAQAAFLRLIPFFERKIQRHIEEDSLCPEQYEAQLCQCYDGLQTVLARASNKLGCLQYAEAYRKRSVVALPNFQATCKASNHSLEFSREIWGTDHMNRMVSEQSATVLYYTLTDQLLLLWVMQPALGVVRFYNASATKDNTFVTQITTLLSELHEGFSKSDLFSNTEPRALPLKDAEVQHIRSQNLRLSSAKSEKAPPTTSSDRKKPALRRLFDMLVAPVMDILDQLEEDSHLVFVPDKQLKLCPFSSLLDFNSKPLGDRFHISCVPCLLVLDRVVQNEMSLLSAQGELEFQRRQARHGGIAASLREDQTVRRQVTGTAMSRGKPLSLKEVSNPRLASSQGLHHTPATPIDSPQKKFGRSRESTFMSLGARSGKTVSIAAVPEDRPTKSVTAEHVLNKPSTRSLGLPTSLDKMLSVHSLSTLTTRTSTGTDITTSSQVVPEFKQVSDPRDALVFGCPSVTHGVLVHEKEWQPKTELANGQKELSMVAKCLGSHAVMGNHCTKREVMARLGSAHIVHIVTWACMREGILLMTPDPLTTGQIEDTSHLLTIPDILSLKLQAKLVVLSSTGLSPTRSKQESSVTLASAFLSAGCQCVLLCLWPVPDDALCKLLFNFYMALQEGSFVAAALRAGVKALRDDERWNHPSYWAAFTLLGKDTEVSVREIKHAQLDQLLDKVEGQTEEESETPILNPRAPVPNVAGKEENLEILQTHLRDLLRQHYKNPQVLPGLIDLLDSSLKRLHTGEINKRPVRLADVISKCGQALAMLKWLGFHFQAKGEQLSCPYIIFPHWNSDELLIPAYDALKAALELVPSASCVTAVCDALPLTQYNISCLIDLMSISKHAPEIQLKVTDASVQPLWRSAKAKTLLTSTGFHQVGLLLTFNMTATYRQLLTSMLQLLLSLSCHKSPVLLYRLDVSLLGRSSGTQSKTSDADGPRLTSLTPLIIPRNQLRMSTPWLSVHESREEMAEKIKLAKSTTILSEEFADYLERARSWHQTTVAAQANESLEKFGRPASMPHKVKVKSGATASQRRVPLDEVRQLTPREVNQRRDYANFVLQDRIDDINNRQKDGVLKLYLPYIKS